MNKLYIAVFLLSSLYLTSALSNTPWVSIAPGIYENSPFSFQFNTIGNQNNLGQAFDSGIFNDTAGQAGQIYNAWYQNDSNGFTYIAEPQLILQDGSLQDSKYAIRVDPNTGRRTVVWWSLQQLLEENNLPTGTNITWNGDTDAVTVTTFNGIDQFIQYQTFQPVNNTNPPPVNATNSTTVVNATNGTTVVNANNTTTVVNTTNGNGPSVVVNAANNTNVNVNSSNPTVRVFNNLEDYLTNFAGYQQQNAANYTQNGLFTNAVNNAVAQVGAAFNLTNVNLTNVTSLNTKLDQAQNTWVRLNGDITSTTDSGNIVAVVICQAGGDCSDGNLQYWWWNNVLYG